MEDKSRRKSSKREKSSSKTDITDQRSASTGHTDHRRVTHRSDSNSADVDDVFDNGSDGRKRLGSSTSGSRRLKSQPSVQSGSGSDTGDVASSGVEGDQTTAAGNPLKSIWRRAVKKLTKLREKNADELANAPQGDIDPVYSFLKVNAAARLGSTVVPPEGHLCCPAAEFRPADVYDPSALRFSNSDDPSKCMCPCHLPQRLEGYHEDWLKAFGAKKS